MNQAARALCCAFAVLAGLAVFADDRVTITPRQSPVAAAPYQIRSDSTLVLVPISVTDRSHRAVTGMDKEDFRLFEDHVEQEVTHVAGEDVPVSVGIIFDTSGSIGAKLSEARQAVARLLERSGEHDEFLLIEFDERPRLVVPFTQNPGDIQSRLALTQSRGNTALLDGVRLGMRAMRKARHPRKALILISDGCENASRYNTREIKALLRESDVQLYAIAVAETFNPRGRTPEEIAGPILLGELADETGGRHYAITNPSELPRMASRIGELLRNQYVLSYSPKNTRRDGKYRKIRVKLNVDGMKASHRGGYYAPSD